MVKDGFLECGWSKVAETPYNPSGERRGEFRWVASGRMPVAYVA